MARVPQKGIEVEMTNDEEYRLIWVDEDPAYKGMREAYAASKFGEPNCLEHQMLWQLACKWAVAQQICISLEDGEYKFSFHLRKITTPPVYTPQTELPNSPTKGDLK